MSAADHTPEEIRDAMPPLLTTGWIASRMGWSTATTKRWLARMELVYPDLYIEAPEHKSGKRSGPVRREVFMLIMGMDPCVPVEQKVEHLAARI